MLDPPTSDFLIEGSLEKIIREIKCHSPSSVLRARVFVDDIVDSFRTGSDSDIAARETISFKRKSLNL